MMAEKDKDPTITPEGAYISGDAKVEKGDFVGRDKISGVSGEDIVKIVDILLKYFSSSYLQKPEKLDSILHNFQMLHQQLYEWKELHNYMDRILQSFEPFSTQVLNSHKPLPIRDLRNLWYPVNLCMNELLSWAGKINWIGTPFSINKDGEWIGEGWAIDINNSGKDFSAILDNQKDVVHPNSFLQANLFKFIQHYEGRNSAWWDYLVDLTRQFRHLILQYMHFADHQLRETATKLFLESQSTLKR